MCRRTHVSALAFLSGLLVTSAAQAQTHQVPYQGHLDLDGTPMNGQFDFWFDLYPTPTGGDCSAGVSASCLWTDEVIGVDVVAGAFSVALGSDVANPLDDDLWQNLDVYLGIRVKAASDPSYTQLTGRQRILAVPMAVRADTAKDYHVTGALTVGAILPAYQAAGSLGAGDGGAAIYNDNTTAHALVIAGNNSLAGVQHISLVGDVNLPSGSLTISASNLSIPNGKLYLRGNELSCPDTSPAGLGQCAFVAYNGSTGYTRSEAAAACKTNYARLCTTGEIGALLASGWAPCIWGWAGDWVNTSQGTIALPNAGGDVGCGTPNSLNTQTRPLTDKAGLGGFCCK